MSGLGEIGLDSTRRKRFQTQKSRDNCFDKRRARLRGEGRGQDDKRLEVAEELNRCGNSAYCLALSRRP